jgi:hypothetical protein
MTTWEEPTTPYLQPGKAIVRLPSLDELAESWFAIAPLLLKATRRTGCYEPIDLLKGAMAGRYGIWLCETNGKIDAAIVTEVVNYPRKRILEMMFVGGSNMRAWLPEAVCVFDRHARQCGCSHICSLGRAGWARAWGGRATGDAIVVRDVKGISNVQG